MTTSSIIRLSLGSQLDSTLNAIGVDWSVSASTGRLLYTVNGETFTPGEAADRWL